MVGARLTPGGPHRGRFTVPQWTRNIGNALATDTKAAGRTRETASQHVGNMPTAHFRFSARLPCGSRFSADYHPRFCKVTAICLAEAQRRFTQLEQERKRIALATWGLLRSARRKKRGTPSYRRSLCDRINCAMVSRDLCERINLRTWRHELPRLLAAQVLDAQLQHAEP